MKIFCCSDTHGMHEKIELPKKGECDVFIFAGDFTARSSLGELEAFGKWLYYNIARRFRKIIMVAGNHDAIFQDAPERAELDLFRYLNEKEDIYYLQDSGCTIDGIKFWGSPWTPPFMNWSFMLPPEEIAKKWAMIPNDTDVLITHGPPFGTLDAVPEGDGYRLCGDKELAKRVFEIEPKAHIFGHIHEAYSQTDVMMSKTHFVNCSFVNGKYKPVNKPIVIEI